MPVKIRLARHGKKGSAHYSIVIADSRAPRDGKFVEKIGIYNPNTNPATVVIDFDRALYWFQTGAQPTETCKAILSYKGVLLKDHLLRGVKKGALTQEQAEVKFEAWQKEKEAKIQNKKESLVSKAQKDVNKKFEAEKKKSEERAADIAKKNMKVAKAMEKAENEEEVIENNEVIDNTIEEVKE
jgi:small subunit ribosomal protein S16